MSIKDLFDKGHSLKFVKNKTQDTLADDVESHRYIDAYSSRRERFVPDVDFATASNFARFGLAEEYYDKAIKRIYQAYPYDGSQAEKIEWENECTYLDLYIFENEYPRTNGFVVVNSASHSYTNTYTGSIYSSSAPQYISLKGGPHADPLGDFKSAFSAGSSRSGISKANIYHTGSQRTNNLEVDLDKGVTVEFWMKKDGWVDTSVTKDEYVFHNISSGSALASYGSLSVVSSGSGPEFLSLSVQSGSSNLSFRHSTGLSNIADGTWHHYAITAKTYGTKTRSNLYVDGNHVSNLLDSSTTLNVITGTMIGAIGALASPISSSTYSVYGAEGWGNVIKASLDEFRYWKTERAVHQIGRFYRDQIGGGTNTDDIKYNDFSSKVDLGFYYKFNEGITGAETVDNTILDYSGRISNGTFHNYNSSETRNTGSAMVQAGVAAREFKDPIIYSHHPDVEALVNEKQDVGSAHDHENSVSIYKSLPAWILEEDESSSNNLKYLTQIMASYFDDLYLQIQKLPNLKDINYPDDNNYEKPLPFAERLLTSRGYDTPELFAGASDLATYLQRDEKKLFEKKLYEVKNIIYQNIYNNLSYIQKSKGTFKSLRNFLRCFGIDEELVKLNIYSNNDVYEFKENATHASVHKRYIDFDDLETRYTASGDYTNAYCATAYQYYDSTDSNSLSYIPAISAANVSGAMMTIETEVIFPKRSIIGDKGHKMFLGTESSIFGLHAVAASNTDLTFDSSNLINFNVMVTKPDNDLRNVKFALKSSGSSPIFTDVENSNSYAAVYNNEKWNLAFRLRPTKAKTDTAALINSSVGFYEPASSAYTYELYGVNYLSNILQNEFTLSGTISYAEAESFFTNPKRIFLGALRTNFTGSVQRASDVKVSSTRVWMDYLSDETIRAHARDPSSYGAYQPYRNSNDALNTNFVPQISTLILNWTMDNVTGSDSSGQFLIQDFASGSTDVRTRFGDSWAKPISKYNFTGRGDLFVTNSAGETSEVHRGQAVDVEFVQSSKQKLPEVVNSDDMVKILNKQDDVVFTRDTTYIQHLLSVEKSMYQVVSEEMLRFFATITSFNNLVGEPVNRYRMRYKKLEKLRELFFQSVENERLDLEKFTEFYKWIDDAVSIMIAQLIPVSSNTVDILRNMVESHILERNKYCSKFPTFEANAPEPDDPTRAIGELKYNWRLGHAPLTANNTEPEQNTNQDKSTLWWKTRAERSGVLSSGVTAVDTDKESILKIAITEVSSSDKFLKTDAGTRYIQSFHKRRGLSKIIDISGDVKSLSLKAGGNPENTKIHDFYKGVVKWGSDDDFIYLDVDNEIKDVVNNDKVVPVELDKKEFRITALTMPANETLNSNAQGTGKNDSNYYDVKSTLSLPFSIYSSSLGSRLTTASLGYMAKYTGSALLDFTNVHEDKYGTHSEIPLQGPFTEKYVGGHAHRHVALNIGSDGRSTRPEGWHLEHFSRRTVIETVISEDFANASTTATSGTSILSLPMGSAEGDPSSYEYWKNGLGADNSWTFLQGPTPTVGTGPSGASLKYAYCEVLPSKVGQTFGLVTPLVDMLDNDGAVALQFDYHMFGTGIGTLKVQASTDENFLLDVEDVLIISGQQHPSAASSFTTAKIDSDGGTSSLPMWSTGTKTLTNYKNKRFYIRFLYIASPSHLGDCAIDEIKIFKGISYAGDPGEWNQNSFKLLSPTHDDHNRPSAIYTRDTLAKRPINIRNIALTSSTVSSTESPTIAGNYRDRYQYVNTTSPVDPWFIRNVDSLKRTTSETLNLTGSSIQARLLAAPTGYGLNYTLLDRTYMSSSRGPERNRTRIKARFSAPGGFEVMSRGFLDPVHEIYSVYNAMPWRNNWGRKVYNSQLQAHSGRFGLSTHEPAVARVYGSETVGSVSSDTAAGFTITGDASVHKHHRNNIERRELSGSSEDYAGMTVLTQSSYDNAFVSHMIPRTDNQTRWITASLI